MESRCRERTWCVWVRRRIASSKRSMVLERVLCFVIGTPTGRTKLIGAFPWLRDQGKSTGKKEGIQTLRVNVLPLFSALFAIYRVLVPREPFITKIRLAITNTRHRITTRQFLTTKYLIAHTKFHKSTIP